MSFVLLVLLSSVSVVDAPESKVIGSHEAVKATVGDDVILPCRLEPPINMNAVTVEWTCNKTFVHVFRNKKDNPGLQAENFRGRTSLFHDELVRGNISLKLTNVTERDAGKYTCFVPKLDSQVRRGFVTLIVEPAGERKEGNPTNNQTNNPGRDTGRSQMNTGVITIFMIAIITILVEIAVLYFTILRPTFRGDRAEYNLVPMDGNVQSGSDGGERRGQDGVEPQEEDEGALMEGQDGGGPQEE